MNIQEVQTKEELERFNEIVKFNWKGEGYEEEPASLEEFICFIVKDEQGNPVGTVGLKKIDVESEEVQKYYPFKTMPELIICQENVYEIDKLSILPGSRGQGFLECLLSILGEFGVGQHVSCFVALSKPELFYTLKRKYKLPVTQVSERFEYKGADVIPMALNMHETLQIVDQLKWLLSPQKN